MLIFILTLSIFNAVVQGSAYEMGVAMKGVQPLYLSPLIYSHTGVFSNLRAKVACDKEDIPLGTDSLFPRNCVSKIRQGTNNNGGNSNESTYFSGALSLLSNLFGKLQQTIGELVPKKNNVTNNFRPLKDLLKTIEEQLKAQKLILIIETDIDGTILDAPSKLLSQYNDWYSDQGIYSLEGVDEFEKNNMLVFSEFMAKNQERVYLVYNTSRSYGSAKHPIRSIPTKTEPHEQLKLPHHDGYDILPAPFAMASLGGSSISFYQRARHRLIEDKNFKREVASWLREDDALFVDVQNSLENHGFVEKSNSRRALLRYKDYSLSGNDVEAEFPDIFRISKSLFTYTHIKRRKHSRKHFFQDVCINKGAAMRYVYPEILKDIHRSGTPERRKLFFIFGNDLNDIAMLRPDIEAEALGPLHSAARSKRQSRYDQRHFSTLLEMKQVWSASFYPSSAKKIFKKSNSVSDSINHPKVRETLLPSLYGIISEIHDFIVKEEYQSFPCNLF